MWGTVGILWSFVIVCSVQSRICFVLADGCGEIWGFSQLLYDLCHVGRGKQGLRNVFVFEQLQTFPTSSTGAWEHL